MHITRLGSLGEDPPPEPPAEPPPEPPPAPPPAPPHPHGLFPGWWSSNGWLRPERTIIYGAQPQDLRPLYFLGGAALLGILFLSLRRG